MRKNLRVYADTSVIGGCFDPEFREHSRALLGMVRDGRVILLLSELLSIELRRAAEEVQAVLADLPSEQVEPLAIGDEAEALRDAYLAAGIVGPRHSNDALHVALATVARCDVLVSWNVRHIVQLDKIRAFNAVNLREGYLPIEIRSPREIVP